MNLINLVPHNLKIDAEFLVYRLLTHHITNINIPTNNPQYKIKVNTITYTSESKNPKLIMHMLSK